MLTDMLTSLQRGLVLKSTTYDEGETFYTIILRRKSLFPWMYKTATIYKDWRGDSPNIELLRNKKASSIKDIKKKKLTEPSEEEYLTLNENFENLPERDKEYLRKNIENIPEKIKKIIHRIDLEPFSHQDPTLLYGFEMQNVSKVNSPKESNLESWSKKLSEKVYKKALSIIPILPL
jgi:hypothetical protein